MLFKKKKPEQVTFWRVHIEVPDVNDVRKARCFQSGKIYDWHDASYLRSFLEKRGINARIEMYKF